MNATETMKYTLSLIESNSIKDEDLQQEIFLSVITAGKNKELTELETVKIINKTIGEYFEKEKEHQKEIEAAKQYRMNLNKLKETSVKRMITRDILDKYVSSLNNKDKIILKLYFVHNVTIDDISKKLNEFGINIVKSLNNSIRVLRNQLDNDNESDILKYLIGVDYDSIFDILKDNEDHK